MILSYQYQGVEASSSAIWDNDGEDEGYKMKEGESVDVFDTGNESKSPELKLA